MSIGLIPSLKSWRIYLVCQFLPTKTNKSHSLDLVLIKKQHNREIKCEDLISCVELLIFMTGWSKVVGLEQKNILTLKKGTQILWCLIEDHLPKSSSTTCPNRPKIQPKFWPNWKIVHLVWMFIKAKTRKCLSLQRSLLKSWQLSIRNGWSNLDLEKIFELKVWSLTS